MQAKFLLFLARKKDLPKSLCPFLYRWKIAGINVKYMWWHISKEAV